MVDKSHSNLVSYWEFQKFPIVKFDLYITVHFNSCWMRRTKIFIDTEFTGLHQRTTLISLGMVAETGEEFYAEFTDYDKSQLNEWIETNVIKHLELKDGDIKVDEETLKVKGNKLLVKNELEKWLKKFEVIEIWADVLAYDWVLFCELFGGAFGLPENIFYTPFDLATVLRIKGMVAPENRYEKDVNRFEFANIDISNQHHALWDARVEMLCYEKLMN